MKSIFIKAANIFLVGVLLLFIAENYLSFKEFPLLGAGDESDNLKQADNVNDLLGWTNDMGVASVSDENNKAIETTDEKSRRVTPYVSDPASYAMVLGCSYTFGIGVSDHDNFIWKAGEHFSDTQFYNYAVIGYGTHQCRAMMRHVLEENNKYSKIFYFFMSEHLRRNRGFIFAPYMNGQYVAQPWARMVQHKPEYHGGGPVFLQGSHLFRIAAFFQCLYIKCLTEHTFTEEVRVPLFNAILGEMLEEAQSHNAEFYVCFLDADYKNIIYEDLISKGVHVLDMTFPDVLKPQYKLHGVGHPNAEAHKRWAEIFCKKFQEMK